MARDPIQSQVLNYVCSLFAPEDEFLQRIRNSAPDAKAQIQLGAEEGKFICLLLQMVAAKTVLEIGTLVGYSTAWIARALPADGKLISIEKSEEHYQIAQSNLGADTRIELINGAALDILSTFEQPIDACFIDANKTDYPQYFEHADRLLRPGGLIIADNTLLWGEVLPGNLEPSQMASAMREFNNMAANHDGYDAILLPTVEGMTVARKKLIV